MQEQSSSQPKRTLRRLYEGLLPPAALAEYNKGWSGALGFVPPDRKDMWRIFYNFYLNCIRDNDRSLRLVVEALDELDLWKDTAVVFTSDHGEVDKVWEVSEFLNGSKGKFAALTDPERRAFYRNPDKALLTEEPPQGVERPLFLIRIKALTANRPILFAAGRVSHVDQGRGNKHFMFGAIVLDMSSK